MDITYIGIVQYSPGWVHTTHGRMVTVPIDSSVELGERALLFARRVENELVVVCGPKPGIIGREYTLAVDGRAAQLPGLIVASAFSQESFAVAWLRYKRLPDLLTDARQHVSTLRDPQETDTAPRKSAARTWLRQLVEVHGVSLDLLCLTQQAYDDLVEPPNLKDEDD